MAFKRNSNSTSVPDSPEELFRQLPRRKIPDVLPHQRELMRLYTSEALNKGDVALQLPTGSGKTLVGLVIAEWRRRKYQERVVYLCPTRQLVNQVVEQAEEKYGLSVVGFTGPRGNYKPSEKAAYNFANRVAVTTYSSLFNVNPFFSDADVLIVDDVHAAENYVAALWSVRVERNRIEHEALYAALRAVMKPFLKPLDFARLAEQDNSYADRGWVDKLPTRQFTDIAGEVAEVVDTHAQNSDLAYSWGMIRDHLNACHMYFSTQDILIRPLIPPTWTHDPFASPRQRIYMSATLGAGGDLERLVGRHNIHRLHTPDDWGRQGVGRRFFVFPSLSLDEKETRMLRLKLIHDARRSLVLVPRVDMADKIAEEVVKIPGFQTFGADEIENSKKPFVSAAKAVAVVANRYDGIDFPGDECRLLVIEGLPKATNLQERFLMSRMGANVLFNERIQTRVLQAIGRCTRSLEDYSAVVVSGESADYLADIRRRKFLHPELQAEIEFGVDQSKGTSLEDLVENFNIFLENGEAWEQVNQDIVASHAKAEQKAFPAIDQLAFVVVHEIEFQKRLWQGDYEAAYGFAESVLGGLSEADLRGYRALWHYLAGSAAWLGANSPDSALSSKAHIHFSKAKGAAPGVGWLVMLAGQEAEKLSVGSADPVLLEQIERLEVVLEQLGTVHDRKFASREKEILDGLVSSNQKLFERAHMLLGELVGFDSENKNTEGAPDPWWIAGNLCFVFEDYAGAQNDSVLDVGKARQVCSHPNWMRSNVEGASETDILPVLITPVTKVSAGATPNLEGVAIWPLEEFRNWGREAIGTVRELRRTFYESGDLVWRAKAVSAFKQSGLDAVGLHGKLRSKSWKTQLEPAKLT